MRLLPYLVHDLLFTIQPKTDGRNVTHLYVSDRAEFARQNGIVSI